MSDETFDARMERLLRTLPPALRGMGFGDPDDAEYAHASDVVAWAIREIDRLREERLTQEERDAVAGIALVLGRLKIYPEQVGRTKQDDLDLLWRIAGEREVQE